MEILTKYVVGNESNKDGMDICGYTCQQVMNEVAQYNFDGCKLRWLDVPTCSGVNPPEGFTNQSSIQELCPNACRC